MQTALAKVKVESGGEETIDMLAEAFVRYGKGSHPAQLDPGDCYAPAKRAGVPLLYRGKELAQTDMA